MFALLPAFRSGKQAGSVPVRLSLPGPGGLGQPGGKTHRDPVSRAARGLLEAVGLPAQQGPAAWRFRRHAPGFTPCEQLGHRAAAGLVLEIEITERLSGGVVVSLIFLGRAG
jgi:hypothetical protein